MPCSCQQNAFNYILRRLSQAAQTHVTREGCNVMNNFPVIGDLVMRTGLWDRQGANIASRYKEMYGSHLKG